MTYERERIESSDLLHFRHRSCQDEVTNKGATKGGKKEKDGESSQIVTVP